MNGFEGNVDNLMSEINSALKPSHPKLSANELQQQKQEIKILIVEDELTYKPFWNQIIESVSPGAVVDWVVSAEAAEKFLLLEYERNTAYDLVILDIMLSGEATGVDLWTRFKEAGRSFIFVSKLPIENYESALMKGSANPICLEKPLDASRCREIIETLLKVKKGTLC